MAESGQLGVIGALLSKVSNSPAPGRQEADRSARDDAANGAGDRFGEIFDHAGAADQRSAQDARETGVIVKGPQRAELLNEDGSAYGASAPGEDFGALTVQFQRQSSGHSENIYSLREHRPAQGVVNPLAKIVDGFSKFSDGLAPDRTIELSQRLDAPLTTIKLSPPAAAGEGALDVYVRRNGGLSISLQPEGASGLAARVVDGQTGLSQLQRSHPAFAPGAERFLELRPTIADAAPALAQGNQNITPPTAPVSFLDAYSLLASPIAVGQGGSVAALETDALFEPILSAQAASTRSASGPALVASSTAPSFVSMSGVLPQIQAAVFARNGRDFVEVRLDPPDLGRVRIDFNVENGETIRAVVGAERSETLDHLKRHIADLENQLKQAGFASISFEFNGDHRQFADDHGGSREAASENAGDDVAADIQHKIYLSLRENAQLDLLL